jgi:hypothetical protein
MTKDRFRLVDASISLWYHCMYRCCRNASMLSDENGFQRKDWIDQRLKELNSIFAISVGGFSTMDSHLHLLLRIDCEEAENWSDQEVVDVGFASIHLAVRFHRSNSVRTLQRQSSRSIF